MSEFKERLQKAILYEENKLEILERIQKDIVKYGKSIKISDDSSLNFVFIESFYATEIMEDIIQKVNFDIQTAKHTLVGT